MTVIDANQGECQVFTFKEGLLSPIAHDLKLKVARWSLTFDADSGAVSGSFDPTSIVVVCARKGGQDDVNALSNGDKRKIEKNIQDTVLKTRRFGEVRFAGQVADRVTVENLGDAIVTGDLTLAGKTRPIRVSVQRDGSRVVAKTRIHQPDFGVKPYSAMFGALKVQADVEVELSVDTDTLKGGA